MKPEDYVKLNDKHQFIQDYLRDNKRLMRLLSVACCYLIWDLIKDEKNQRAVEVAELYADGLATEEERAKAHSSSSASASSASSAAYSAFAYSAADYTAAYTAYAYAAYAYTAYAYAYADANADANADAYYTVYAAWNKKRDEMSLKQGIILQNMKGNWDDSWKTKDVTDLAATIYNEKRYELMPILADALIEAGCNDEQILNYCQTPNFYFRGCWVLDKATGKR